MAAVHDIVVVGAGHNGLVAANYLADAGLDVAVLEANESIGGMTATGPRIPGAPNHLINSYSVDAFFWDAFPPSWELELHRHGLRRATIDPGHVYLHPDGSSIAFWADARKTAEEIARFSRADGRAYLEFADTLRKFGNIVLRLARTNPARPDVRSLLVAAKEAFAARHRLADLGVFPFASVSDVIAERFEHQVVRDALHAAAGSTVPNSLSGTGISFLWLSTMHRYPCQRPIGGVQAIPDALARRLRSRAGTVRTGSEVAEILVRNGSAGGVRLADGTEVTAREGVVGACDPSTTLGRLLPGGTLSETMESRVANIPVSNLNCGQMKVDIALSERLEMRRHQARRDDGVDLRQPSHLLGTERGIAHQFARAGAGLLPEEGDLSIWPVIPTAMDPSQAPDGQDTLYLYCAVMPYAVEGGWDTARDKAAQLIVDQASEYFDGLAELEIGRQVLTNGDFAAELGATGGNITHVDMVLGRTGPLRPARGLGGFTTPVDGLYLAGAGCHPGGGITGGSGYLSARRVIADKAKARGRRWHRRR